MTDQPITPVEATSQVVVFDLDAEEYAIPIADVREVIKIPEITPVPNSPDFVLGIINLRGKVYSIINLETRFKLTRQNVTTKPRHIIIVDSPSSSFGVMVDQVSEVLRLPRSWIQPAPESVGGKIGLEFVKGVVVVKPEDKQEPRTLLLLNLKEILTPEETNSLSNQETK